MYRTSHGAGGWQRILAGPSGARNTSGATSNTTTGTTPTRPGIQKTDIRDRMSACGGARGIRTPDLLIANETRYQLRHSPKDSNSLAPWRSATQADHDHVRDTTDRKKRSDSPVYATPLPNTTPRRYPTLRNAHELDEWAAPAQRPDATYYAGTCSRTTHRTGNAPDQ